MIFYLALLLPPANFLLLFANLFPRSTSNSEMPTAEGKYLFSFCFFFIVSPRLDLNNKIFAFWEDEIMVHINFLLFYRFSFCEYTKT